MDLMVRLHKGADPAFQKTEDLQQAKVFYMTQVAASNHLCSRGYNYRAEIL